MGHGCSVVWCGVVNILSGFRNDKREGKGREDEFRGQRLEKEDEKKKE